MPGQHALSRRDGPAVEPREVRLNARRIVMEVVTLGVGEEIVLGGNIYITVVAVEGEEVHLAVSVPESVPVECQPAHAQRDESRPP
jgi:hypothetical protein